MDIGQVLKEEFISLNLKSKDKINAISELVELADNSGLVLSKELLLKGILEREAAFTTKIMDKIAIPHAKTDAVKGAMIFLGRSDQGIVWEDQKAYEDCAEEEKVYLIFLILVPGTNADNFHLKLLASLARCLSHESFREDLLSVDGEKNAFQIVANKVHQISAGS